MEPPDVIRRPCMGLPIGAPCPDPSNCICAEEGLRDADSERGFYGLLAVLVLLASAASVAFGAYELISFAFGADVDNRCMTHAQAKAAYPSSYLYWRTANHCWYPGSNHPRSAPATAVHYARVIKEAPVEPEEKIGPTVAYPSLMSGGGTDVAMLQPDAMTTWPLIFDVDEPEQTFIPWSQRITFEKDQ